MAVGGVTTLTLPKRSFPKIDIIAYTKPTRENRSENNRERILSGGGSVSCHQRNGIQRTNEGCVAIGNTHPSGRGMNGVVYLETGMSPALTTNKGEGNKIAIIKNG